MTDPVPTGALPRIPGLKESAALAEAILDPLRVRVITEVGNQPGLTAREISERLSEPLRRVRHQLAILRDSDLVEVCEEGMRRGAIEHHYSLRYRMELRDEDLAHLADDLKRRLALAVFRQVASDVSAATKFGSLAMRRGHVETRFVGKLDDVGWQALSEICVRAGDEIQGTIDGAAERLARSGEIGAPVTAAIFLLERTDDGKRRS